MSRRAKPKPRVTQTVITVAGFEFVTDATPWCDCPHPEWKGLTRRADGIWVRACCMRRSKDMYDRFADEPVHSVNNENGATT